jgi:hypothetical protein
MTQVCPNAALSQVCWPAYYLDIGATGLRQMAASLQRPAGGRAFVDFPGVGSNLGRRDHAFQSVQPNVEHFMRRSNAAQGLAWLPWDLAAPFQVELARRAVAQVPRQVALPRRDRAGLSSQRSPPLRRHLGNRALARAGLEARRVTRGDRSAGRSGCRADARAHDRLLIGPGWALCVRSGMPVAYSVVISNTPEHPWYRGHALSALPCAVATSMRCSHDRSWPVCQRSKRRAP